jgi:hypothetical protein
MTNTLIREVESDADRYSLVNFNEPDGLAKALVKTIEYRAATPSKLEEVLFYDHPAVGVRVRRAMDWKAAHPKAQLGPAKPGPDTSGRLEHSRQPRHFSRCGFPGSRFPPGRLVLDHRFRTNTVPAE